MKDIRSQNNTYRWLTLNKAFKWTENLTFKFQKVFNQTKIKTLIEDFHNSLPSDNIDSIGTKLTNILNSVGTISLRRKKTDFTQKSPKRFTGKTKTKCKLWFDKECDQIKNDINSLSNQKSKSPLDNEFEEKLKLKMKEFKTICQKKRNVFWNEKNEKI